MINKSLGAQSDLFGGDELLLDSLLTGSQLALKSLDPVVVIDSQGFAHFDQVLVPPVKTDSGFYVVRLLSIPKPVRLFRVFSGKRLYDTTNMMIV